jgi:mono/diheme cytochrome c family protein
MAKSRMIGGVVAALVVAGAAVGVVLVWRPAIAAIDPPSPQSFPAERVKRGRELAALGNCNDCHTVRGATNFAGGLPVPTPFGTVFSTNITPDPETGIGRWSEEAFRRAMRSGVDREGRHLYPTFPYDHFTNVTDEDDRALYAYLMTREPVDMAARPNRLRFPFNLRFVIAGWKLLFLRREAYRPDGTKSAEWNRGAYLVEGLAHCGACHTPRNALGAERAYVAFSGGEADDWSAYAVNRQSPAPVAWDVDALDFYLRNGWHPDHGTARGPMAEVVRNLAAVPASDVHAIAVYMADVFGTPRVQRSRETVVAQARSAQEDAAPGKAADPRSAAIYGAACAGCHDSSRPPPYGGINLALSSALSAPDPRNLVNIVLAGVRPVEGEPSPIMPGFAGTMNDQQLAVLVNYLRSRFTSQPPWSGLEKTIEEARRTQTAYLTTSAGPSRAPADAAQRDKP